MNRITSEDIQTLLDSATVETQTFYGKVLVAVYKFPTRNGFTIVGHGSCVDPRNFNEEVGKEVARRHVEEQLWQLEGYRLQLALDLPTDNDACCVNSL